MSIPAIFERPDETPLARSPIVTVLWQLRCEEHEALISPQTVLKFQEQLGGRNEFSLTQLPKVMVSLQAVNPGLPQGMPAPPVDAGGGGWRLSSTDGTWHINVETSSISIESSIYGSWITDFSPRIERALKALAKIGPPVVETRLGLRYVNIVVGSAVQQPPFASPSDISSLIAPWLLGPLIEPALQEYVQMARNNVIFKFEEVNLILNHGIVSTENRELGYLLDIDAFREGGRPYDTDDILAQSLALHNVALGIFQMSLIPKAIEAMRS